MTTSERIDAVLTFLGYVALAACLIGCGVGLKLMCEPL